ncbi:hypothetical protein BURPS305_3531 [Burkholderia pseudomallei 305]|nr:hypothetical protein BURPS305_3531 [Burkholderia pseudomallei 305]
MLKIAKTVLTVLDSRFSLGAHCFHAAAARLRASQEKGAGLEMIRAAYRWN